MKNKYSLLLLSVLLLAIMGFTSGYQNTYSDVPVNKSSEICLIDSVNDYASSVVKEIESEYLDIGVKASIGITDIRIQGEYALVSLLMERYDPVIEESFKSYHVTQWQLQNGEWII